MTHRGLLFILIPGLSLGGLLFFAFITYQSVETLGAKRIHNRIATNTRFLMTQAPEGNDLAIWRHWLKTNLFFANSEFTGFLVSPDREIFAINSGRGLPTTVQEIRAIDLDLLFTTGHMEVVNSLGARTVYHLVNPANSDVNLILITRSSFDMLSAYLNDVGVPLFTASVIVVWISVWVAAYLTNLIDRLRAQKDLEIAVRDAEEANRAITAFLANMSHELRTPLNPIIGFSQILKDQTFGPIDNEKYREYVSLINQSGLHLQRVIGDILDMTRIQAGEVELDLHTVNIAAVIGDCRDMMSGLAQDKGVNLISQAPGDLPPMTADPLKLRQILLNLLSNAVKFTPAGGQITVTACLDEKNTMVITVADTGRGMAPEHIPLALKAFSQIRANPETAHEGTGLGLAISKSYTEAQGGRFSIHSELGRGTTVMLGFPLLANGNSEEIN